ncbi:hypothetical protein niasHS_000607 [Heterodera schachtii]|uniref:DUF1772-domain-containing protein n=2 Tax=Heterodera TaxID=34509 RepID=A0ABD2M5J6_9BILA
MSSYMSKYSSSFYAPATEPNCHCASIRKLGICASAAFTGAALYINLAEQPSRLQLETAAALKQFKESYTRAIPMQAGLAILSGIVGIGGTIKTGEKAWAFGAALMLANIPYTFLCIFPVNKRLLATNEANADENTRADLQRWGRLHAVRTVLGLIATGVYLYAVSKE